VAYNFSPFIYANGKHNIAITGKGTIDGGAAAWSQEWRTKQNADKDRLRQLGSDLLPDQQRVFGHGFLDLDGDGKDDGFGSGQLHYLRPSLIELYECQNILIEGVNLRGSCFWTTHPVFSKNVTIRNLTIFGGYLNDDGINPDSCEDVLIENCQIKTKDDAISIKAGRDQDAWSRQGTKNVIIRNCRLNSEVNALCIGSEMSGGVAEVFAENCQILSGKHAFNFKSNLDRGGTVKEVFVRNMTVDSLAEEFLIFRMDYHGYRGNNYPTKFRDFYFQNIKARLLETQAFKIVGVPKAQIERLWLQHIQLKEASGLGGQADSRDVLLDNVRVNGVAIKALGRLPQVQGGAVKKLSKGKQQLPVHGDELIITDFGADASGAQLSTKAIQQALDQCEKQGGGVVIVPAGTFLTGTLFLPANLTLHLRAGARLLASTDLADYDPEHPHLLYAKDARNIALTGTGTIDGQGDAFFDKRSSSGEQRTQSWRARARPQPWLLFEDCERLRFRDLELINSPAHVLVLQRCRDVLVDAISIQNDPRSPNTDGIDITNSRDVRISNCRIITGDDAICLKSKTDTVENILVTNCYLNSDDAGIKFGTGTAVCIRDCRFNNLVIEDTRYGIALFMLDGGVNEHCTFDNITIRNGSRHQTEYPIFIDIDKRYPDRSLGKQRFLTFSNLKIFTRNKLLLAGQPEFPLENIT
ncbi:MAG: glycosyl hydrolase family 28 protein, partial [Bacteroidota bacterium]